MKAVMSNKAVNYIAAATFIAVLVVNTLSGIGLINGIKPGEVSDLYQNLFTPASYTFSIWGLIYLLLSVHTVCLFICKDTSKSKADLLNYTGRKFIASSLMNICWIFSWHYKIIPLSMLFITAMLVYLCLISNRLINQNFTIFENLVIRLPFSVYFGWITVAATANLIVLLVSLGWNSMNTAGQIITIIFIGAAAITASAITIKNKDAAYCAVAVWAYIGILNKHLSPHGFDGEYLAVITAVILSIIMLFAAAIYTLLLNLKNKSINI